MATSLNRLSRTLLLAAACLPGSLPAAEQLPDPTRPAIELVPTLGEAETPGQKQAAGLQSVILSLKREAAIINGTEVAVGEKVGDAVLTEVNETCVVLTGPEGRRVMHMYPTVSMSKTEMECRRRVQLVSDVAVDAVKKNKAGKKAKAKRRNVVCAPVEENKDGGGK